MTEGDTMSDNADSGRWIDVLDDASLREGEMCAVYPLGRNVVVARVDGVVHAVDGACAHMGCPLFTGSLSGGILTCPCHDWRFDVRTGQLLASPDVKLAVYPVRTEAGRLLVQLT